MSPIAWIFLAGLGGIGLYESIKAPTQSPTLEYVHQNDLVVVRMSQSPIDFPMLAARISLPTGWSYLSTTSPELAEKPTFVNEQTKSIMRIHPAWSVKWNPRGLPVSQQELDDIQIEWLNQPGAIESAAAKVENVDVNVRWNVHRVVRIGRLTRGELKLVIEAISYDPGSEPGFLALFRAIQPGNAD